MSEVMTRIELGGVLGKTYGMIHHRLIRTTAEAINSLTKTIDGLEKFLITSKARGLTYAVFKDKKNIGKDDFGFPVTGEVIRIVPVVIGSKKAGVLQTILGAVLVVAGIAVGMLSGGTLSAVGYGAAKFGAAMIAGGVVQMLSPQPGAWPANKAQITVHRMRSAGSQTPPHRVTRFRSFTAAGESAGQLFPPGFMSKISSR